VKKESRESRLEVYLVGGAVRDELLGLPVHERDWVVVGATAEQMLAQGYRPVGKDFPVFLHPDTNEEYALARTERKQGRGYYGFVCYSEPSVSLEEDLLRRDITINAMAKKMSTGEIIDPYGGQRDLQDKKLRHVSSAFVEDPVRLLRVARFAARYAYLGFCIAPETLSLMRAMVRAGEVDALVPERVWQEIDKVLAESQPQQFFMSLRACGALTVLLPELDRLFGVPNASADYTEIDTGMHSLFALQQAVQLTTKKETSVKLDESGKAIRFAALVAQLGKGATPVTQWPEHVDYASHSKQLIQAIAKRYHISKAYHDLALLVANYHQSAHAITTKQASEIIELLEYLDAFRRPQRFAQWLVACEADWRGRQGFADKVYLAKNFLLKLHEQLLSLSAKPLIAAGLQGEKVSAALRQQRLELLEKLLAYASR
jgi:tRNA nucleotidyltransferase (CCA-adding enzyme)